MQAPERRCRHSTVVLKESPFRSARGSNVSPGSTGHIWHAPWIQDDAFEMHSGCLHGDTRDDQKTAENIGSARCAAEALESFLTVYVPESRPHFLWHVDLYDKLKPYKISINSAIDWSSQMVIWLYAYSTNSEDICAILH